MAINTGSKRCARTFKVNTRINGPINATLIAYTLINNPALEIDTFISLAI